MLGISFLAVVLSIPVGGVPAPAGIDVYGAVRVVAGDRWPVGPFQAVGTPWGYLASREAVDYVECMELEEVNHARQAWQLGPGFLAAYALTLGEALEPYSLRRGTWPSCASIRRMEFTGPGLGGYPSAWARVCGGRWRFGVWPVAPGC